MSALLLLPRALAAAPLDPADFIFLRLSRFDDFAAAHNVEDVYDLGGVEIRIRAGELVPEGADFVRRQSIPERDADERLGDGDAFPDPGERINFDVMLENRSDLELTGVQVFLFADRPEVACPADSGSRFGTLGAGESRFNPLDDRFRFVIDTGTAAQSMDLGTGLRRARLAVAVRTDQLGLVLLRQRLSFSLDLDVSSGSDQAPGTYSESFEDPLGASLTLDGPGGLASQPCPPGASASAPDCVRGSSAGVIPAVICATDPPCVTVPPCELRVENGWHVHTSARPDLSGTGKASDGVNSLHWGRHAVDWMGNPGDTYLLQTVQAFLGPDLNLPAEGSPVLSLWHIAEFCDEDCWSGFFPDTADDYSIVEVRADVDPAPGLTQWTPWERVVPFLGPYDGRHDTFYTTPTYEPADDLNPFLPEDPVNTTCLPNTVFVSQGSARGLDATACTDADGNGFPDCGHGPLEDDPALRTPDRVKRGETGVGVWVRSEIDLGRYAGRHIQYRFLATTVLGGLGGFLSYLENVEGGPPSIPVGLDIDDGWYIDDIRVAPTVPFELELGIDTTDGRDGTPEGIALCPEPASATLALRDRYTGPGATAEVPLTLSSTPAALPSSIELEITYDPAFLQIDPGAVLCGPACAAAGKALEAIELEPGRLGLSFLGGAGAVVGDGEVAILPFEVAADAPLGGHALGCERALIQDPVANALPATCLPGAIQVIAFLRITPESLSWGPIAGVSGYDVVRGDLSTLNATGGDFTAAARECLASNQPSTSLPLSAAPPPGEGDWLLMRPVASGGPGSYDTGSPSQTGSRDGEINASPASCP